MKLFKACMMCFSMFCRIPCPYKGWDEDARPLMTLFFPTVGAFIGVIWAALAFVLRIINIPLFLTAAALTVYPFLVTGCMHMDGFMDVTDATYSWRDKEERLRILKDSHTGAFAVIGAIVIFIVQFAAFASVKATAPVLSLLFIPICSRAISGAFITGLKPLSTSQYSGNYRKNVKKSHIAVFICYLIAALALAFIFTGVYAISAVVTIIVYMIAVSFPIRSLGGMSGDISGFGIVIGELAGIIALAVI